MDATFTTRLRLNFKPSARDIIDQSLTVDLLHKFKNVEVGAKFKVVIEVCSSIDHVPEEYMVCASLGDGTLFSNVKDIPYPVYLDCTRTVDGCTGIDTCTHATFSKSF